VSTLSELATVVHGALRSLDVVETHISRLFFTPERVFEFLHPDVADRLSINRDRWPAAHQVDTHDAPDRVCSRLIRSIAPYALVLENSEDETESPAAGRTFGPGERYRPRSTS
jgi:hypothetical protein